MSRSSLEDQLYDQLRAFVDDSPAEEAAQVLEGHDECAQRLWQHAKAIFGGNTEEGSRGKLGDWLIFCRAVYSEQVPEVDQVCWPPSLARWEVFLTEARPQVSSFTRFKSMVGNVCEVAIRYWSKRLQKLAAEVDPR